MVTKSLTTLSPTQNKAPRGHTEDANGWWTLDPTVMLPVVSQWKITKERHDSTHLGKGALKQIVPQVFGGKRPHPVTGK